MTAFCYVLIHQLRKKETKNNKIVEKDVDKNLDKRNIPCTSARKIAVEKPTTKQPRPTTPEQEKAQINFNIENELAKINISIPLSELAVNSAYKPKVEEWMNTSTYDKQPNSVNFEEDHPKVVFGLHVEQQSDNVPPFYVTLNVHEKILHNCMLNSGSSHNLMPKAVMEKLGLEITRPYHDLFSFDAKKVKCIGLIKYLVISLTQLPMKSVMIDIVVADVLASYGMLLS